MKLLDFVQTFTCIKSIVTLGLTGCFIYMCITGSVSPENFMTIYTMVIGFYFGTQWQKKNISNEKENRNG